MTLEVEAVLTTRVLASVAGRNYGVIQRQVVGLTHADSLLQLPFRGNCLNWVLGHITQSRDKMLQLVDAESVWTAEQIARYERGSEPVLNGEDALPFEKILADFGTAHERLTTRLETITADELAAPSKRVGLNVSDMTVEEFLQFLLWHETYHVGQTEILRQLAGTNDKVI
jgi:uncharacterized damage-inducible protein DinB